MFGAHDFRVPRFGADTRVDKSHQFAGYDARFQLGFLVADHCLRELRDKRSRSRVNRRRIVRGCFSTNARRPRRQRRRVITTRNHSVVEKLRRFGRLVALHRDLTEANVGPGERRCKRQRLRERCAKEFLRLVDSIFTEQRTREDDLRFLKSWRAYEHRTRSRFRLRKILSAKLQRRFVQRLRQILSTWHHVVAVVELWIEFVRINFDPNDFRRCLKNCFAKIFRRYSRFSSHFLALFSCRYDRNRDVDRAKIEQRRHPLTATLHEQSAHQISVDYLIELLVHQRLQAVAATCRECFTNGRKIQPVHITLAGLQRCAQHTYQLRSTEPTLDETPEHRTTVRH